MPQAPDPQSASPADGDMPEALARKLTDALVRSLTLAPAGDDLFVTPGSSAGTQRLFGGQIFAQAMLAACHTVAPGRPVHAAHGNFLSPGAPGVPVHYRVSRDRDGAAFSARRVEARQADRLIFTMSASFHRPEAGFVHSQSMPEVAPPETLETEVANRRRQADAMFEAHRDFALRDFPIDLRPVSPREFVNPKARAPLQHYWFKPLAPVPDDPVLATGILAYATDMMFLSTALLPHGVHWSTSQIRNASLDHGLWIHKQPDLSDWLLYTMESPWAEGARAMCIGSVYDRGGNRIATVTQEGLLRPS